MKPISFYKIIVLLAVIVCVLYFFLLTLLFNIFVKKEPQKVEEKQEETGEIEPIFTPYLSEIDIGPEDLYSVYWEEKDIARWMAEESVYISEEDALDLVNLTKDVTNSTSEIDYRYILSVMKVESNFKSDAISPNGAIGYMQLIPRYFTSRLFDHGFVYLSDPVANITLGVEYLDEMYQETDDLRLATMGYNMGLESAKRIYDGTGTSYTKLVESAYTSLLERVS